MNGVWFLVSLITTIVFLFLSIRAAFSLHSHRTTVFVSRKVPKPTAVYFHGTGIQIMLIGLDAKEFVNSPLFSRLDYATRENTVKKYLYKESRVIYDCLLYRNKSKCFSFNQKESIYAKKVYRTEDMVMKYPHPYHTLLDNPNACADDPYIVIGSPVGPRQFVERVATRETWGGIHSVDGKKVIHLFFMGHDENDEENDRMIREENDRYHDIIQFDMRNHFMNLTLLAILTYNWTATYCPHIAYYVRSDNDMYYNPRLHIRTFLMEERSQTLIGNIVTGSKPIRIQQSRYWMPKSVFPRSMFDPYPSGCFVTITGDALRTIVEGSEKIETILYFDDVFLGMVARKTDLTLLTYPGNTLFFYTQAFKPGAYAKMSAAHRYAPVDLLALWQIVDR